MTTQKLASISLFLIFSLLIAFTNADATVHDISGTVTDDSNYNKAEFTVGPDDQKYYFKYTFTTTPASRIGAFRFDFDQFDTASVNNEVLCTFVDDTTADSQIVSTLDSVTKDTSACIGTFKEDGIFDGIFEYDKSKKRLAILLKTASELSANVNVYVRNKETTLSVNEQEVNDFAKYSLIPYTIHISHFRTSASKILFYSKTRDMQMYYVEGSTPYPERLFFGNIMSVYTNPEMVRQKYKNADTMILLTRPFNAEEPVGETFQFQVKFFASDYLLDYYMGTNPDGREKNTPLAINMTECSEPYYVILNYNKPESKVISLYIDEIYGNLKSLSVAPTFSSVRWEDMITKDLLEIDINARKYDLPKNSQTHMDVYKIECSVPSLLNFYYVDSTAKVPDLDYGKVAIASLKANKVVSFPFVSGIETPQLTIEIFNPVTTPFVMINDGINEYIINKNSLTKAMLLNTNNAIVVKERGGDDNTRVIIKVGYNTLRWEKKYDYVVYNQTLNTYVFSFPVDAKNKYRAYALLETSGTNTENNVKYCYGTNIGSAILPSSENCYRVSDKNSYTIKIMNPAVMYKDYELDETLIYYVSLRPTSLQDSFNVKVTFVEYDAKSRNVEAEGNVVTLSSTTESTILGYSTQNEEKIFYQITSCSSKAQITYSVLNAYKPTDILVPETTIAQNTQNYFGKFDNIYGEAQLKLTGTQGDKIFVKHKGMDENYSPNIKSSFPLSFDQSKNAIVFSRPLNNIESLTYTVYVSKKGGLSAQALSICSLIDSKDFLDTFYTKTFSTFTDGYSLPINFNKLSLKQGDEFEAIAFIEQDRFSQMSFVTDLLTGTVGEIKQETIIPITTVHTKDNDYVYYEQAAQTETSTFYYSFVNSNVFDVPVGAFRIELDSTAEGSFSTIYCAWVDEDADPISMVDAIDEVISTHNSYCYGGKNKYDTKKFNYMFKYTYTSDNKPRKMIIKVPEIDPNTKFTIYIRKGANEQITQTDFSTSQEYGRQEEYKLSLMPYILDLSTIRGDDTQTDYVSKVLIYSKFFEMQMYYIGDTSNSPIKLFTGNVMLVYTKPSLAEQKYFSTKLILFTEYIRGQEHSGLGNSFRFHTKMFRSTVQIEYYVSNNLQGRTINFPLSLEMNTCTMSNDKYYYILNYNMAEEPRNLYLDLIYGSMNSARIVTELTEEKWDDLINNQMVEIKDYFATIPERSQHIDIVEIRCATPLLVNAYYNYDDYSYSWVSQGDVVVKNLASKDTFTFYLDTSSSSLLYYSIEVFNPQESPNIVINFNTQVSTTITQNSLLSGFLFLVPESISVVNNGNTQTRFIFKVGFEVENSWQKEDVKIDGTLFSNDNKWVYKFPISDKKLNFTNVTIDVKPMKKQSEPLAENIKFCYSTSLGMPIKSSQENCFRTGVNIPYSLTFINPLISPKLYRCITDNYYVTLTPQDGDQYISLTITENKYDTKDRNIEGAGKVITLESAEPQATILTIPQDYNTNKIIVQLQACKCSSQMISYANRNAYTLDLISSGNVGPSEKLHKYELSNMLMETKVEFTGQKDDQIFVKHVGVHDYDVVIGSYTAIFDERTNIVTITKPILNEEFTFTVLVGPRDHFKDYTLCTFAENKQSAAYIYSFPSVGSNEIPHYIDFRSFNYKEGTEFDLLVYAVQTNNSKLEFLYTVVSGVVGKIEHVFTEIEGPAESNVVTQAFNKNNSNYLYYDFTNNPVGDVASLKVINEGEVGVTIAKVICDFVKTGTTDLDMLDAINNAAREGKNLCKGDEKKDSNGYDAIINAEKIKPEKGEYKRLIIMIQYGFGDNQEEKKDKLKDDPVQLRINLRISGFDVSAAKEYNENEANVLVPYVLDLKTIRGDQSSDNYISKVLIYSNKRELEMYHLKDGTPTQLFSGNILLVYTNEAVVKEKYHGATTMILLTESLFKDSSIIIGENFRFKTYFFKSDNTMNYFVSSNPNGRPINIPTIMELPSCDKPYYYILNYHYPEERDLTLHIDQIYGEIATKRIATQLNKEDWYALIDGMEEIYENEYLINQKDTYHMDVIEATCSIPSLLNIYYTDDENPILTGLGPGDTSIINLGPNEHKDFQLQTSLKDGYTIVYSFNVLLENDVPNIGITFPGETIHAQKNGIYIKKSTNKFETITVTNEELGGSSKTRVIFKYGYEIEDKFEQINNGIYHLNETSNLFGYKFNTNDSWLNYTSISFMVSTMEENVKFCYSTNLGSFMEPSLQDCYRVGISNTYTITVLNPYLMYKDYTTASEEIMKYYVAFKTVEQKQNITITPTFNNYATKNRNLENIPLSMMITKSGSTILTSPAENTKYIFFQMKVCSPEKTVEYQLLNAYNKSSLNIGGNIFSTDDIYFSMIENIRLDTELSMTLDTSSKIFVKHTGMNEEYYPDVKKISLSYNRTSNILKFNKPISNEAFTYTIYVDKRDNLKNQDITLCSVVENTKLAHYSKTVISAEETIKETIDFSSNELKDLEDYDMLVLATQINNGKLMILSNLIQGRLSRSNDENNETKTELIIIVVVLTVILICGGIIVFICLKRYKNKPNSKKLDAKQTSLAMVDNENEKMIMSTATEKND